MVQIHEEGKPDLVAVRLWGTVTRHDYDTMLPIMEEKINRHGKINVLAEIGELEDFSIMALWQEVKFDLKHLADFRRVAVVANQKWLDRLSTFSNLLTPAQVRYFLPNEKEAALTWVKEIAF